MNSLGAAKSIIKICQDGLGRSDRRGCQIRLLLESDSFVDLPIQFIVVDMAASAPSPCAACKLLRRRCTKECVFAPHFPPDEPLKFASVHRVFGASNVNKVLQELPLEHRADAVSSMVYEAHARIRDPVYGCVGAISSLQQQVTQLQTQLALAQAEILYMKMQQAAVLSAAKPVSAAKPEPAPAAPEIHHNHFRSFSFSGFDLPDLGELLWT